MKISNNMILTDKAKEDFLQWNEDNDAPLSTYAIEQGLIYGAVLNAILIEWFDSVGIYVNALKYGYNRYDRWVIPQNLDNNNLNNIYTTRQEATKQAIIKANEIYNGR